MTSIIADNLFLGEGALWHPTQRLLYYVDILNQALYKFDPITNNLEQFKFNELIGSYAFCHDNFLLVSLQSGLYLYNSEIELIKVVYLTKDFIKNTRFNDSKVDRSGKYYLTGTMDIA